MRKILLLVLLFAASRAAAQVRVTDCTGGSAFLVPKIVVARSGETVDVVVRTCWGPAALPYDITVLPAHIAEGTARIYPGFDSVTLRITARQPGVASISYTLPQFGRAPSTRLIGRIHVVDGARRRSVRTGDLAPPAGTDAFPATCAVYAGVVEPGVIVLEPGQTYEARVRICRGPSWAPWSFDVAPSPVASGHVQIPAGATEATLTIVARAPGVASISYSAPNLGRSPSTRLIGHVHVVDGARRRSARH